MSVRINFSGFLQELTAGGMETLAVTSSSIVTIESVYLRPCIAC
jgi:hypothetical protein